MYIRQDTVDVNDYNEIRFSLYNIEGFPSNIENNIGKLVSICLNKKKVDNLKPFLEITTNTYNTLKEEIDFEITNSLKKKGFKEIDPNDLSLFIEIIDKMDKSLETATESSTSEEDSEFKLEENTSDSE